MPKVEFVEGIQCRKCGHILAEPRIFSSELCQKCGAKLMDKNISDRTYILCSDGEEITVKRTRKLFHNLLERVY